MVDNAIVSKFVNLLSEGFYSAEDISTKLDLSYEYVKSVLDELESNLTIISKDGMYTLVSKTNYVVGDLYNDDGKNYVVNNGKQIYIDEKYLNGAKAGDKVIVKITNDKGLIFSGSIIKHKSNEKQYTGTVIHNGTRAFIVPDNKKGFIGILDEDFIDGTVLGFTLKEKINAYSSDDVYKVNVVENLGHKDDIGIDRRALLFRHKVQIGFPDEVLESVKKVPQVVTEEELEGRVDLRDKLFYTIDPKGAKDFDDSVCITKLDDDKYRVDVAVADVTYYANMGSPIFETGVRRGTSYYLSNSNVPMIPRELSNGICSLNPNVDRMALVFSAIITKDGEINDFNIFEGVINSKKKMTYDEVNDVLEKGIISDEMRPFVDNLKTFEEVYKILQDRLDKKGFVDFRLAETRTKYDEEGNIEGFEKYYQGTGQNMIEVAMLLAGELASLYLDQLYYKHVYRVHSGAIPEKVEGFIEYAKGKDIDASLLKNCVNSDFNTFLNSVYENENYDIIARKLLKCTSRSFYSSEQGPHFAIGIDSYAQVTSPMRRGGDLICHSIIKEFLKGRENPFTTNLLNYYCKILNSSERNADKVELQDVLMCMALYMKDHIGEEFEGRITNVSKFSLEVELDNNIIGRIPVDKDYELTFDESTDSLRDKENNIVFESGKRVKVEVSENINTKTGDIQLIPKNMPKKVKLYTNN